MPSTWVNYKGLQLPSAPTGDAGVNLKTNFIVLADRGIPDNATLGGVAFVGGTVPAPAVVQDSANFFWDNTNKKLGIGTNAPAARLEVKCASASMIVGVFKAAASQTASITEWQSSAGTVLSSIRKDGSLKPAALADSAAVNDSIYYSTTVSKLVYKDPGGVVRALY